MTIRVLVVDDSATIRQALCTQLKERGFETDTARNGKEALDKLQAGHTFNVVITDLMMPGLVGGEMLINALQNDPALTYLPVIVVSAFQARESQLRNLEHGAAAFFGKPWDADLLAATIRYHGRHKSHEKQLEDSSLTDALTGLGNRRYGEARLQEAIDTCRRYKQPLSVALVDIDHFKLVNDEFGHAGGDDVLRHVAAELRSGSRSIDVAARWGGEEFLFIFEKTGLVDAAQIVERFRSQLAAKPVDMPSTDKQSTPVKISGGAAELEVHDTPESLLARVDEALYEAKAAGRNQLMARQAGRLYPVKSA